MKIYSVYELMELLKLSEPTVRKIIKSGKLKSLGKIGPLRVTKESLDKYLKGE